MQLSNVYFSMHAYKAVAKGFDNDTNINLHKDCCLSFYYGNLRILQNVMKSDQKNWN